MNYYLRIRALGSFPTIVLDAERFLALKSAKAVLTAALTMEEIYEILIANYKSLEEQLIRQALGNLVYEMHEYSELFASRLAFNTAFVNLLTAARLFVDQICSRATACAPLELDARERIKKLKNKHYDASAHYRFMEELRNHVQHAGLAVNMVRHSSERRQEDNYQSLQYSVQVTASKNELEEEGSFKKAALEGLPENIDLIAASREYIEALSSLHQAARNIAAASVANARAIMASAIHEYRILYGQEPIGLNAMAEEKQQVKESLPILLHWDEVRIQLERRNSNLVNLSKRYVTGRLQP